MKGARRIRIIFSDPDATDSDSADDATSGACRTRRKEIVILHGNSSGTTEKNPAAVCDSKAQAIGSLSSMSAAVESSRDRPVGSKVPNRRHRGVYERQPGRWAAEFRSHRLKVRHWVGTFPTEEEARAAYDAFEKQFLSSPSRRHGVPAPSERGDSGAGVRRASRPPPDEERGGGIRRASRPPPDEKRQIVLALTTATMPPPPAASVVPSTPCASSSTSASSPPSPPPFWNAQQHDADEPPSVHSIWADEPVDEFLLAHMSLPFSSASMDFDPIDLSLFDDGFL